MSYQALYRKYRPSTLEDVIGQDVVIKILKNALKNNKVGHAYLFSGPRGIGKTSIAKSLAKAINCLDLKDGCSCEKCENCASINSGFNPDIIEIDAASNNGVDEIREIKNKINLMPNGLKYKIYIIDEVHMLSIGAFNALLKTLEEPPEHIIFILATTDPQKVPSTIISRCQCFEFNRISNENIVKRLEIICDKEKIDVEKEVLYQIAVLSEGGLRDSIGMLDKLNSYSNEKITMDDFEKVNGIVSIEKKEQFLNYVHDHNIVEIIKFLDEIHSNGKDLTLFVQNLIELCKNKCVSYYLDNIECDIDFNLSFSKFLSDLYTNIKNSSNVKTTLEISILSFINKNVEKTVIIEKIEEKVDITPQKTEKIVENIEKVPINQEKNEKIISQEIISGGNDDKLDKILAINKQIINNCLSRANKKDKQLFEDSWKLLNDYALDGKFGAAASFISDGVVRAVSEGEVIISFNYESMVNRGFNLLKTVQNLFEKVYNKRYDVAFITNDEWNIIKEEFIANKNNGITYEYIPLDSIKDTSEEVSKKEDDSITSQAISLFGDNVITVN